MSCQDVLSCGDGGELMQPGGDVRGEQRAPHSGRVHLRVSAGQVPEGGTDAFDNFPPQLTGKALVTAGKLPPALFGASMQQLRLRPPGGHRSRSAG